MQQSGVESIQERWLSDLKEIANKLGPLFRRTDAFSRAFAYVWTLLSNIPRKNRPLSKLMLL